MNRFDSPTDDELRFDRLVDGELSDTERQQLLAMLDDEPGGWRRCALAFLEAQAWRQSLQGGALFSDERPSDLGRAEVSQPPHPPGTQVDVRGTGRTPHSSGLMGLILAMAACFTVAFFLGSEFRQRMFPIPTPPTSIVASQPAEATGTAADVAPRGSDAQASPANVTPWGEATFVLDDAGREVEVPVFDLDPDARQVLLESSTAAFEDLHQHLQRRGYAVERNVRWSPVEMGGGQQMYVPVGDFEITPISHRALP